MFGYTNRKNSDIQGVAGLAVSGCEGPSTMVKSPLLESNKLASLEATLVRNYDLLTYSLTDRGKV